MPECVLCYDDSVSKGCVRCVFEWCRKCHKKLDSCPVCRKEISKSILTTILIVLIAIFYGVSFYFVPFGVFIFVLRELNQNTSEDHSIILIMCIQFIYSLIFIIFTVFIHHHFCRFES